MKKLASVLLVAVIAFLAYFYVQAGWVVGKISLNCVLRPDCNCIDAHIFSRSATQKQHLQSLLRLDYLFMVLYGFLLGFWCYMEMQCQKIFWLNNLLRLSLPLVFVVIVADLIENFFLIHYLQSDNAGACVSFSFVASSLKWAGLCVILLTLLISVGVRLSNKK